MRIQRTPRQPSSGASASIDSSRSNASSHSCRCDQVVEHDQVGLDARRAVGDGFLGALQRRQGEVNQEAQRPGRRGWGGPGPLRG